MQIFLNQIEYSPPLQHTYYMEKLRRGKSYAVHNFFNVFKVLSIFQKLSEYFMHFSSLCIVNKDNLRKSKFIA